MGLKVKMKQKYIHGIQEPDAKTQSQLSLRLVCFALFNTKK